MKKRFAILKLERQEKLSSSPDEDSARYRCPDGTAVFSITAIGSVILQSAVNTLGSTVVAAFTGGYEGQAVYDVAL